jgi:putative hydrolase of the HAD superfamily
VSNSKDKPDWKRIKGLLWDLDNTLYRADDIIKKATNLAVARAAVAAGAPVSLEEAVKLATRSYEEKGYSGRLFIERFNLDNASLHQDYHGYIDETVIRRYEGVEEMFTRLALPHALITHASRDWARRVLTHLGLASWFPPERILALEDYNFRHKHECRSSFEAALNTLALQPQDVAMVEDVAINLKIPHGMGITTVFLDHGRPLATPPSYIRAFFPSAVEFLHELLAHRL